MALPLQVGSREPGVLSVGNVYSLARFRKSLLPGDNPKVAQEFLVDDAVGMPIDVPGSPKAAFLAPLGMLRCTTAIREWGRLGGLAHPVVYLIPSWSLWFPAGGCNTSIPIHF